MGEGVWQKMTNAEKFLKDGVDEEEFVNELHYFWWANEYDVCDGIRKFLHGQAKKKKPTLTEDERVILRNLDKKYKYISRNCDTELYLKNEADDNCRYVFRGFNHLFKFIKKGEEYEIAELLKGE